MTSIAETAEVFCRTAWTRNEREAGQMMLSFEFAVLNFIQNHLRTDFLDLAMPLVSRLGGGGEVWLLLALVLVMVPSTRKAGAAIFAALALEFICCNLLAKPLIGRVRPCDVNQAVQLLVSRPLDFSFPSGHSASSFAAACALYFSGSRLWKPALILATLIAFSRLYLYVHYPSDVAAGILLGAAAGWAGARLVSMAPAKFASRAQ